MGMALTYRGGLGADSFTDWVVSLKSTGGIATAWPFSSGLYGKYYGRPAAKFTGANYARAANSGLLDMSQPQQATANSAYVYVLAPGAVAAAAPPTMNWVQRAANEAFTIGDIGAAAVGLPSLATIESFLKKAGVELLVIAGVIGVAYYLINRE
jgi:hypothetical protein